MPAKLCGFLAAMAMSVISGSTGLRPAVYCAEGSFRSVQTSARCFLLQRPKCQENWWRVSCVGADVSAEWRRECTELRGEIHELRGAVADAWMQDEMRLVELERLVAALVGAQLRSADEVESVELASEARDTDLSLMNFSSEKNEKVANETVEPEVEGTLAGVDAEIYQNEIILSELRSEELRSKQEGLSTLRRLKTLNVHEYVHSALQASHMRSWLKSRGIAE